MIDLISANEFVYVIVRKDEIKSFNANKEISSVRNNGQKMYKNYFNFIEAKNNDGSCSLNKATYSSELCEKLLEIYAQPNSIVYDSFMGTGTTAIACQKFISKERLINLLKEQVNPEIEDGEEEAIDQVLLVLDEEITKPEYYNI